MMMSRTTPGAGDLNAAARMFALRLPSAATRIKLGVGVVIRDDRGRVLLERRADCSLWGLPGGRVDPGESVMEAAVREVREETGLVVEVVRLVGVYSEPADGRIVTYPEAVVHAIDILLEARVLGGRLERSAESEALEFFAFHELPATLVPGSVRLLEDVAEGRYGNI